MGTSGGEPVEQSAGSRRFYWEKAMKRFGKIILTPKTPEEIAQQAAAQKSPTPAELRIVELVKEIDAMRDGDRHNFLGSLREIFCLQCGERTRGDRCWGCYDSPNYD